jgi:glutaminase
MNLEGILQSVFEYTSKQSNEGKLASYIPELAKVDPNKLGVYITTLDQKSIGLGDYNEKFSIQSIAKVLSCTLAYKLKGESIWKRVGVEPSGSAFNSLLQLEADNGIPRNPFINAGALVICDILVSELKNPKTDFLNFVRDVSNNYQLSYNESISRSEKSVGYRNTALCNYIKALGNIENEPEVVLDFYFTLCSIEMSCKEVTETFLFLANGGVSTKDNQVIVTSSQSKRINALMLTCGFYDESGEFAFKVGLPGKSGVGGGTFAIMPNQYCICVWSPKLNGHGNSQRAMLFLEEFTNKTQFTIF